MSTEKNITFNFNFHAPVGQNIAHVDRMEVHYDKDMTMQVVDTKAMMGNEKEKPTLLSCIEMLMEEKDENGGSLVTQASHWIAIFRVIVDKRLGVTNTDYQGFCNMIAGLKDGEFRVPLKYSSLKAISKTNYTLPLDKWKYDPAYNPTRKPYDEMVLVATRFLEILDSKGL